MGLLFLAVLVVAACVLVALRLILKALLVHPTLGKAAAVMLIALPLAAIGLLRDGDEDPDVTSPAQRYRSQVARDIEGNFPEANAAVCEPTGATTLRCEVEIGPTPGVPQGGSSVIDVTVSPDGDWSPDGPSR